MTYVLTEMEKRRRVCWMLCVCLTMPAWHPTRTQRLPELAEELAEHVSRHPLGRPS